jgi:tetratricopeptide (TPR) repeat protein
MIPNVRARALTLLGFLLALCVVALPSLAHAEPGDRGGVDRQRAAQLRGSPRSPRAKPTNPVALKHFLSGHRFFRVREFDKAIAEYKAGALLEDVPVFQYNLAQSYRMAGQYEEALWHYENFLGRLPPGDPSRAKVEGLMAQVKSELSTTAAASKSKTEPVSATKSLSESGSVNLRDEADDKSSRASALTGGVPATHSNNWGWGISGVGSLLLGSSAIVFHLSGNHTYERAKSTSDDEQRDALVDTATSRRYVAQGLAAATVVCAGVAVYLFYSRSRPASRASRHSARLLPTASPHMSSISLIGSW